MTMLQKKLKARFPSVDFQFEFPLKEFSYFKIGGPAEVFVKLISKSEVIELIKFCRQEEIKVTLLGGASNVVIADEGIKGLVLKIECNAVKQVANFDDFVILQAESGIEMIKLVKQTIELGLSGLEYFGGVPGSLGGAIYNNAHYLSNLIGDHITKVEVLGKDNKFYWLSSEECQFSYDSSRFHQTQEVILSAEFKLKKADKNSTLKLMREANRYRAETQPLTQPSSGCIFQNVRNNEQLKKLFPQFKDKEFISAGFIIDQAGLKGEKIGDIQVSTKHAAFMVNLGFGTADQVKQLIKLVKNKVQEKFAIKLKEEVIWIGS